MMKSLLFYMVAMLLHFNVCYKEALKCTSACGFTITVTRFYCIHSLGLTNKAGILFQAWACHCSEKTDKETRTYLLFSNLSNTHTEHVCNVDSWVWLMYVCIHLKSWLHGKWNSVAFWLHKNTHVKIDFTNRLTGSNMHGQTKHDGQSTWGGIRWMLYYEAKPF